MMQLFTLKREFQGCLTDSGSLPEFPANWSWQRVWEFTSLYAAVSFQVVTLPFVLMSPWKTPSELSVSEVSSEVRQVHQQMAYLERSFSYCIEFCSLGILPVVLGCLSTQRTQFFILLEYLNVAHVHCYTVLIAHSALFVTLYFLCFRNSSLILSYNIFGLSTPSLPNSSQIHALSLSTQCCVYGPWHPHQGLFCFDRMVWMCGLPLKCGQFTRVCTLEKTDHPIHST